MIEPVDEKNTCHDPRSAHQSNFEYIKLRIDGSVARMTLNRPDHNLLNEAFLRELTDGITIAGDTLAVKLDRSRFRVQSLLRRHRHRRIHIRNAFFRCSTPFMLPSPRMLEVGKPVICVVNGPAIGGGAELAAFGDLVIATPKARFAQPEISIGVFPPLASTILPFLVGPKRALEIVLTGEAVTRGPCSGNGSGKPPRSRSQARTNRERI